MPNLEKLQAQIAKLQARADDLIAKQASTVIADIRDLMAKHGITAADIAAYKGNGRGRSASKALAASPSSTVKYRNPKTGETWSGRGRAPSWIAMAKNRARYLVDGIAETSAPLKQTTKKVGNYPRGPQPPKYRDPQSGATWSGRGRAPAWLGDADRWSRFLIEQAPDSWNPTSVALATESGTKASEKVVAKKAKAKKTIAKKAAAKKAVAKKAVAKEAVAKRAASKKAASKKVVAKKAVAKSKTRTAAPGTEKTVRGGFKKPR
jgi:DNA-binding protein H-NS